MPIEDSQRIEVDVEPLTRDAQHLRMVVYNARMKDSQGLEVAILPAIRSPQRLLVAVRNQAYEAAAEKPVIAPDADITFE